METRSNQASLVGWFYDIGISCGSYDRKLVSKDEFFSHIAQLTDENYADIYCRFGSGNKKRGGVAPTKLLHRRRALEGIYTSGRGWN